jgi:hypothetical protein
MQITGRFTLWSHCAFTLTKVSGQDHSPFQDPDRPEEVRAVNLVSLLTLDEKVGLLRFHSDVPRLGIHGPVSSRSGSEALPQTFD